MSATPISDALADLRSQGVEAVARSHASYAETRRQMSWNRRLADARSPDLIVRPGRVNDLALAVKIARKHGLRVSPRGGGHSYEAAALRDGGMLLDLSRLNGITIDAGRRTAHVGVGVHGGDLLRELARHGLAFPVGHCPDVSLSGYLLSGGFGWNSGTWGPACSSLLEVDVVLADDSVSTASEAVNADILWAARGAGAGFPAIATGYRLQLHPLPGAVQVWNAKLPAERAPEIAAWLTRANSEAHPSSELTCMVGPDIKTGKPVISLRVVGIGSDQAEARHNIAPFLEPSSAAACLDEVGGETIDFVGVTDLPAMPPGKRVEADHLWSDSTVGDMLLAVHHSAGRPRKASAINIFATGGSTRMPRFPNGETGALSIGGGNEAGIYAMWDDPEEDDLHIEWVRAADLALAPHRTGRYVGEANLSIEKARIAECFSPEALARIETLKERYDPESVLHGFPG